MDTLEILKYINLGIISIIVFCMVLAVIGGIFRLLLDVIVFIIVAPFYILLHPIMFVTKPKVCLKNILRKTPNIGEDMEYAELRKNHKSRKITELDLIVEKEFNDLHEMTLYWQNKGKKF